MKILDACLDETANTRFLRIYASRIKEYEHKFPQFTENEIASILMVYHKFALANGPRARYMTTQQFNCIFLVIFKIYDLNIINRILALIGEDESYVSASAWMHLIAIFASNSLELRMRFAFQVYDTRNLGYLTRAIITLAVNNFFTGDDEDEIGELRNDMVEFIIVKFDQDRDGHITYDEYAAVVTKQPQMIEFLGRIFPTADEMLAFAFSTNLTTFIENAGL